MKNLFLFLKGLLIGLGKIVPGVSGSFLAVILGVYEQAIYAINHFKEDKVRSLSYLIPLGIGILLSTIFFSHILLYFLTHYYLFTMFFFLGLILGTVPSFQKKVIFQKISDCFLFMVSFCFPFLIPLLSFDMTVSNSIVPFFFLGFLDAATMIIPGISGTAIYLMLNAYEQVLAIYSHPFSNVWITGFFGFGMLIGVFLVSWLVEFCLRKNRNAFFLIIDGLLWSSIVSFLVSIVGGVTLSNFGFLFLLFGFGFFLSQFFSKSVS